MTINLSIYSKNHMYKILDSILIICLLMTYMRKGPSRFMSYRGHITFMTFEQRKLQQPYDENRPLR